MKADVGPDRDVIISVIVVPIGPAVGVSGSGQGRTSEVRQPSDIVRPLQRKPSVCPQDLRSASVLVRTDLLHPIFAVLQAAGNIDD